MKRNFLKLFNTHRNWPFHWGGMEIVAASILSIAMLSLGSGMFGKWISAAREAGILPISLHSLVEADYSVDTLSRFVPAIGLDILRDLLGISGPLESEDPLGILVPTPETPSPTPTPTIYLPGELPTQIDPTKTPTASAIPTQRSTATATQTPPSFYTPTWTQYPTDVPGEAPTWTMSPPIATKTPKPPSTETPKPPSTETPKPPSTETPKPAITVTPTPKLQGPTATNTDSPPTDPPVSATPTDKPTAIPTPSLEPGPTHSATSRPTHSPTLALTPTAQYTPGVTVGAPVEP